MVRAFLAFLLVLLVAGAAQAATGTVHLHNGEEVSGKLVLLGEKRVCVRTARGVVKEFTREQVKYVTVRVKRADGKIVTRRVLSRPKPLEMPFRLETRHFVIQTDTGRHVCKNAGRAMEQLYKEFQDIFGVKEGAQAKKTELVIFKEKADFLAYAKDLGGQLREGTLGFYRWAADGRSQIVAYKRQTEEHHTLSTLYHEATHHFLKLALGRQPPLWLNEGLAVFFETSRWERGRLKTGVIPRRRLKLLQRAVKLDRHYPLAKLMTFGKDKYDALAYAEGWSLVYFLLDKAGRKRFGQYLQKLRDGDDPDEAFKSSFTDDIQKLEEKWKAYVENL
ncbi:MAG: peptidase MA family metallohydrolase [bacterium]